MHVMCTSHLTTTITTTAINTTTNTATTKLIKLHTIDACHAVTLLKKYGIPEEKIITMMYDDIAHHPYNPFPGQIFNHPTKWRAQGNDGNYYYYIYNECRSVT